MQLGEAIDMAEAVCEDAGMDSDKTICRFTLADVAAALLADGYERADVVSMLPRLNLANIGDVIVEASHWDEVIPQYVEDVELR